MAGLNAADRQWLDEYGEMLRRDYPDVVARLAVFGSKARGEADAESDLDVLLLVRDAHEDRLLEIEIAGYELRAADEGLTMPQIVGTTESWWRGILDKGMVFPTEVDGQAIDLIRDGVPVATAADFARRRGRAPRRAEARVQDGRRAGRGRTGKAEVPVPGDAVGRWKRALQAFRSAKLLADNSRGEGAVSLAHDAFLNATRAALLAVGIDARKHHDMRMEFNRRLIGTGDLPEEWKRFYLILTRARVIVDYSNIGIRSLPLSTAHDLVRRTGGYLGVIRRHLEAKGIATADLGQGPAIRPDADG